MYRECACLDLFILKMRIIKKYNNIFSDENKQYYQFTEEHTHSILYIAVNLRYYFFIILINE